MDRTLAVRQAGPADHDAIRAFVTGLSPRTQYLRFFACVAPPSTTLLRALCGTAGRADILVVTDSRGLVIAHAMAADAPAGSRCDPRNSWNTGSRHKASRDTGSRHGDSRDPGSRDTGSRDGDSRDPGKSGASSIGLVVADEWQRRGIGTALLDALAERAARRGVGSLVLEVLPDNRVMLGIIRRRWPDAPAERTPDAIVFRPAIAPAPVCQPVPGVLLGCRADQCATGRPAA